MHKNIRKIIQLSLFILPITASAIDETSSTATNDAWTRSYSLELNAQYIDAAKTIEPLLKQIPANQYAELRSGWLYYLAGNYSRSIKHYQTALKLNKQSLEARLGLTLPLMAQGRWQEAAAESNEVIRLSAWNYYAHVRLMACEEALKQWKELLTHAQNTHYRYPSDATILVYLARAYQQQGDTEKARQAYRDVLQRVPGHLEASRFLLN